MFYISDEQDGKFGVKDTSDGVVEFYTSDELLDMSKAVTIFGVSKKNGTCSVKHLDEYQELPWGRCKIISFVDLDKNLIVVAVEKTWMNKVCNLGAYRCYLHDDMTSLSTPKNGTLGWIFHDGKETQCAGVSVWLDYSYDDEDGDSGEKCLEFYVELHPDGTLKLISSSQDWDFDEFSTEYIYSEEKDCIVTKWR